MKRLIAKVIVLLLLGAIVNIAVAWGCVWRLERNLQAEDPALYTFGADHTLPAAKEDVSIFRSFGWAPPDDDDKFTFVVEVGETLSNGSAIDFFTLSPRARPGWHPPPIQWRGVPVFVQRTRGGLPCNSLGALRFFDSDNATYFATSVERVVLGLEVGAPDPRLGVAYLLPLCPLWPGFAINTLFYAAVLWVLFVIPGSVKRLRRRRRGQCLDCGYPIGSSPRCSECGEVVNART